MAFTHVDASGSYRTTKDCPLYWHWGLLATIPEKTLFCDPLRYPLFHTPKKYTVVIWQKLNIVVGMGVLGYNFPDYNSKQYVSWHMGYPCLMQDSLVYEPDGGENDLHADGGVPSHMAESKEKPGESGHVEWPSAAEQVASPHPIAAVEPKELAIKMDEDIPPSQPCEGMGPPAVETSSALPSQEAPPAVPAVQDPQHHILDDLANRILTRAAQDEAMGTTCKGRKPKSSKAKAEPKAKVSRCRKTKAQQEPQEHEPVRRRLFQGDGDDASHCATPGESPPPEKPMTRRGRKPAAKQAAKSPKVKKQRMTPKKRPAARKTRSEVAASSAPEPQPLAQEAAAELPAPPAPAAPPAPLAKSGPKPRRATEKLPTFSHCNIVPYWSRDAVALKVPTGQGKSGLTQARP